mmetsp:Transcript_5621/g.9692  ORF Transcript_5621/g.9692 Transcript_5621/m.9692 type:complete len:112 (-) Transcript_5621:1116-1451(-)
MRVFAMNEIFMNHYKVEPSVAQVYMSLAMLPWNLKFLFGVMIDSKVVSKRKYILILFGITCTVTQVLQAMKPDKSQNFVLLAFLFNLGAAINDTTVDTYKIQQARKDPING